MKNTILLLISLSFILALSNSETANTIPKGQFEVGLFQPLKYGMTEKVELSTHPLAFFLMPNLTIKNKVGDGTAARFSIYYPTYLLRLLTREGSGGLIAPDPTIPGIPHMVSIRQELLVTKSFSSTIITAKAGFSIATKFGGELDSRTEIEFPTIYQRLNVFYNGHGFNSGLDIRHSFGKLDILADVDIFYLPEDTNTTFIEHKSMLIWNKSNRFQTAVGYKLVYGEYTDGKDLDIVPVFDLVWSW
ncbi:MAG: hypothetical protein ISR90_00655 [Candidatus Marinimicrobia bacterium]|nr:hypothetical protein [Candidatus Neomarinimicrobiota bacterium]MBL7022553.1 hypothetical protein [Candidatus Neomarinimicrobiota bacterium]MBL7108909.1 hypothetical protein [Candidatus Neomarinimicrobiota bacterium]